MSSNKTFKGKPITTSVPTFAIRFHTNGEELEELYPSEEESINEEKCSEISTASEPPKQESSPMRDYLNKFGKRSSSIDAGINDTAQYSNDPWRIFSEFKGKLTKTVEEKLSEIKNKNNDTENSPKITKTNSKDNSSISDSEEQSYSECSAPPTNLSSTAEDIEMSSDDEGSLVENDRTPTTNKTLPLQSELRNRKELNMQISYVKEQDEIILQPIPKPEQPKHDEEIESGIEACEELIENSSILSPKGFADLRFKPNVIKNNTSLKNYYLYLIGPLIIAFIFILPPFLSGLLIGTSLSSMCFYYFYQFINKLNNFDVDTEYHTKPHEFVVPPIKEYQPITKFEGWVNEYPEVYNPYTYHIAMTQSVYLKLENNILRISHTTTKIPKRAMWNEQKHTPVFTYTRVYNLQGAEVVLLPRGLIHKRIWSKKYPICVIFNKDKMYTDLPNNKKIYKDSSEIEDLSKKNDDATESLKQTKADETESKNKKNDDVCDVNKHDDDDKTEVDEFKDVLDNDKEDDRSITEDWENIDENSTETKLYLFGRTGRDKEDWFRRLVAASHYNANEEIKISETKDDSKDSKDESDNSISSDLNEPSKSTDIIEGDGDKNNMKDCEEEYLDFMAKLGQLKRETHFPLLHKSNVKHGRLFFRKKKSKHVDDETDSENKDKEDKIDKSDDLDEHIWFNVFIGRILYDTIKNQSIITNLQERIQRKLSSIKLPYFIEEITISHLDLGNVSPIFHKISAPTMDERGLWIDFDLTYDGGIIMSIVTKLNLMKLKEQAGRSDPEFTRPTSPNAEMNRSPMFHSDIEDSAESSSDDESILTHQSVATSESLQESPTSRDAKGRKILRMIDNIASSSLFQQATENKYIKRAMEGVSKTVLKLTVEIRALEGVLAVNISAPPSDRIWLGFRGNPKLVLCAKPAFGERSINFAHVTRWIEKKILLEFQKFLVMPNMEDFICPLMMPKVPK